MKRREFISKTGIAAAGIIAAPYILPTGRLFAATGTRLANHVVFVLFAGGIRNQESVHQMYLQSQGLNTGGNIMPNMLSGTQPNQNLVYQKWSPILPQPLSTKGTLFKEMRYKQGPTGHYNGHTVAMTGNYTETGLNLNINPAHPTVFEYYRKHTDVTKNAINAWWLSEGLGPYPSLNYSRHPQYGAIYGANYLRPATTFGSLGDKYLANSISFQPDDVSRVAKVKDFLNKNFPNQSQDITGIKNTSADREKIKMFITERLNGTIPVDWPTPTTTPVGLTGDLLNIGAAWQVLKEFSPELTVINTFNLDVCHTDFSGYLSFLHKSDYGIGWLWNKIQGPEGAAAGLKDDTILICMPEHGRNGTPNNLLDQNGLKAFDHTSDANSREIFSLIVGPPHVVKQNQQIGTAGAPVGESIDIVPTIAHILGFKDNIPSNLLPGRVLTEAFI